MSSRRILRIDSSARTVGSHSRALADHFQQAWQQHFPQDNFVVRDLAKTPVPHIVADTITGFYTPAHQLTPDLTQATALSDSLIAELATAEIVIVSAPIYNFSIPSALKAWIDQIVRIGRTFAYDGKSFTGLLKTKRVYLLTSYGAGGYGAGGGLAAFDHLTPYLKLLFGFLGVADVRVIPVEATTADAATVEANMKAALLAVEREVAAA
ncbi:MAG: NAD(P)H-dependent oxidoreductase [Candidatus Didemnitutus sp.]|nr:NAD(P)H-dependent oxidoreductase [Candidatus Didemnitutus sp.]